MRTLMMMATLAVVAGLLPASAQQPTVREALAALETDNGPAVSILRQEFGPRPAAELATLADRLAEMMADTTLSEDVRFNARVALRRAADPSDREAGTPYPRAFDVLVRAYEAYESGPDDHMSLWTIFRTDPERGPAYVRDLFERSERPALCFRGHIWRPGVDPPKCDGHPRDTQWCRLGLILYEDVVSEARSRTWPRGMPIDAGEPLPVPDGLPEHVEDWHRRCL